MKTRCLLVDDEPLAIQLLQKHIGQIPSFEVVAVAGNAVAALEALRSQPVDLIFCDIRMPGVTGIDLLKTIRQPPKTILTTAYREFALDGYDLEVIDYLLKPITFERFFKAVERYMRLTTAPQQGPATSVIKPRSIQVKAGSKFYNLPVDSILYVESQKEYVKIRTTEREIVSKNKIGELTEQLTEMGFLRIHRSFLINRQQVMAYSATHVDVGPYELPIGASYRVGVLQMLGA
ncbi:MAG: DNA-binding response regulator [Cytophagales bacterium]|nr:MAG: DNA-binding response regulator [Cytophagales bacterium]